MIPHTQGVRFVKDFLGYDQDPASPGGIEKRRSLSTELVRSY
jgi:hypothetical protein